MSKVLGTAGYERAVSQFIEVSQSLQFEQVNADFLAFVPNEPSSILDAGSGAGQNAAALALMGHSVVAVEPMTEFLDASHAAYGHLGIEWLQDSLPLLKSISANSRFDFVLVAGVWHHLCYEERQQAMGRIAALLRPGGKCAITLRNGPAGLGIHLYPTDTESTLQTAENFRLTCKLHLENQPSILENKHLVKWSRIVLEKPVEA